MQATAAYINNQGTVTVNGNNSRAVALTDGGLLVNSGSISAYKGVALDASSGASTYRQNSGQIYSKGPLPFVLAMAVRLTLLVMGKANSTTSYSSNIWSAVTQTRC
ncbi:hypothetical protein LZ023_38640 (plasmid) [Pseudomonas silvicola]|nr:hypothetical protein LZ023_38640 [Pseudomonas silvicola]